MHFSKLTYFALGILTACTTSTGILPVGPNTYTVSENRAPIRGGGIEAQRIALNEANTYCQQQGRVFVPLTMGQSGDLTNQFGPTGYTATFQCVVSDDSSVAKSGAPQTPDVSAAAPSAPIPEANSAGPTTSDATGSNDRHSLDWLNDVRALQGEKFAGVNSGGDAAFLVNLQYRSTVKGTKIIFVHKELKFPSRGFGYLSSRETWEVDCIERKSRIIGYVSFSSRNLEGKVLSTDAYNDDWSYDAPNSMADGVDSLICANPTLKAPRKIAPPKKTAGPKPDFI